MTTILITGGAGFIGSHAVDGLLGDGHAVRVLDDFSTGRRENLAAALPRVDLIEGDVRDAAVVRQAARGCELVLHLAAIASVQRSVETPGLADEVNVGGTENVLAAARLAGGARVVLASSCAVYGDPDELPLSESAPVRPLSPYAVS
jgi:UDP-glucose 4-epimerase